MATLSISSKVKNLINPDDTDETEETQETEGQAGGGSLGLDDTVEGTTDTTADDTSTTDSGTTTDVSTDTALTTEELFESDELAQVAANLAISRGVSPSASWLWTLGGEGEDGETTVTSIALDNGWIWDIEAGTVTDPDTGTVYSYDDYILMDTESTDTTDATDTTDTTTDTTDDSDDTDDAADIVAGLEYLFPDQDYTETADYYFGEEDEDLATERYTEFLSVVKEAGRNDTTESLLTALGASDEQMTAIFGDEDTVSDWWHSLVWSVKQTVTGWESGVLNWVKQLSSEYNSNEEKQPWEEQSWWDTVSTAIGDWAETQVEKNTEELNTFVEEHPDWVASNYDFTVEGLSDTYSSNGVAGLLTMFASGIVQSVPTLSGIALTAITAGVTKNPVLTEAVAAAFFIPQDTYGVYEDMLDSGATEEEALTASNTVGIIIGILDTASASVIAKSIAPTFYTTLKTKLTDGIAKTLTTSSKVAGATAMATDWVSEVVTENIQQVLQNAAVQAVDENRSLTEGLEETTILTSLITLPLGITGGISTYYNTKSLLSEQLQSKIDATAKTLTDNGMSENEAQAAAFANELTNEQSATEIKKAEDTIAEKITQGDYSVIDDPSQYQNSTNIPSQEEYSQIKEGQQAKLQALYYDKKVTDQLNKSGTQVSTSQTDILSDTQKIAASATVTIDSAKLIQKYKEQLSRIKQTIADIRQKLAGKGRLPKGANTTKEALQLELAKLEAQKNIAEDPTSVEADKTAIELELQARKAPYHGGLKSVSWLRDYNYAQLNEMWKVYNQVSPTVREGVGTPKNMGFIGERPIDRIIKQAKLQVELNRPGAILRFAYRIPGLKQVIGELKPGMKFSGDLETILVALKTWSSARADVATKTAEDRLDYLNRFRNLFGKDVLHGAISDIEFIGSKSDESPIVGTLLDIVQRASLYKLTKEQKRLLADFDARNNILVDYINVGYGTDVGKFLGDLEGAHLPNVGASKTDLKKFEGSETRAISSGRSKTRVYNSASERMKADKNFQPVLDVQRLINGMDGYKAGAAGGKAFREALGGKTKDEVIKETHPKLYKLWTNLHKDLNSLKSSSSTLDSKVLKAIDEFNNSPHEEYDLLTLADALDVKLESGPRVGLSQNDIQTMITETRDQLKEINKSWKAVNLGDYVRVDEGNIYRYFSPEMAKYIREVLKTTDSWLLNWLQNVRGMAFSGDLSPIIGVQTPLGCLFDPLGSLKFFGSEARKMSAEKDIWRTFTAEGMAREIRNDPDKWNRFYTLMGRAPAGTPEEFAGGLLKLIPHFQDFNEATFTFVMHQIEALWERETANLIKHGIPEAEAEVVAMRSATEVYPVIDQSLMGYSQARSKLFNSLATSISFIYKPAEMMVDATEGLLKLVTLRTTTPREKLAVKRMLVFTVSCISTSALSAAWNAKANGGDEDDIIQAIIDSLNPASNTFCSIIINNSLRIPIGGPFRALVKAIYPKTVDWSPVPVPFAGLGNYLVNRLSPLASTAVDLITNSDYYGNEIYDESVIADPWSTILYVFENVIPLTLGTVITDISTDQTDTWLQDLLSQFAGFNLTEMNKQASNTQDIVNQIGTTIYNNDDLDLTTEDSSTYTTTDAYSDIISKLKYVDESDITTLNGYSETVISAYEASKIKETTDLLSNTDIYKLNTDYANGDTIVEWYAQWQKRESLIASGASDEEIATFDDEYPDAYKGNITAQQYELLLEYSELTDDTEKEQFLEDHPEIATSAKEQYLIDNPEENAILALWGQADILSSEALTSLQKLVSELGLPESAIENYCGSELVESYSDYLKSTDEYGSSSYESKLILLENEDLADWLGVELDDNIQSVQIHIEYKDLYEQLEALGDSTSNMYITSETARTKAKEALFDANPDFEANYYYAIGLDKGMSSTLASQYTAYSMLDSSSQKKAYRKSHPELEAWFVNKEGYTSVYD